MIGAVFRRESVALSTSRPNILYLHCHDAGRYLQPFGHAIATPSLQRLAEQGTLFRQAFTNSPTCSPSRACLLTGRYAHVSGMLGLAHRGFRLNDYKQHVIHTLHEAGYTSALAGMQHVAKSQGLSAQDIGYDRILTENPHDTVPTNAAIDFLYEEHEKPFFLSVGYFAPHRGKVAHRPDQSFPAFGPALDERYVRPPAPFPDNPQTRRDAAEYAASMTTTDLCMGRVLEALDRTGLADNTLVIATTDHGIAFPDMKCRLTDHGMGVFLILRGPSGSAFSGGGVVDAMAQHLDIVPTICEEVGINAPADLPGKPLQPLASGEADRIHEEIFAEVNFHAALEPMRAVRTERYKYIRHYQQDPWRVLPNCDDGLTKTFWTENAWGEQSLPGEMLFDLMFDPNEAGNLAGDERHAETLDAMRERLDRWMQATDDPLLAQGGRLSIPKGVISTKTDAYSPEGPTVPSDG